MYFHNSGQYFNVVYTMHCAEINLKNNFICNKMYNRQTFVPQTFRHVTGAKTRRRLTSDLNTF